MRDSLFVISATCVAITMVACNTPSNQAIFPQELFRSEELVVTQVSENAYIHTSYLQTDDFGKVACNGLVLTGGGEAYVFDTPTDDISSEALIEWLQNSADFQVKGVVPTHFHKDCLGGLPVFESWGIPSYASHQTIQFAAENNFALPQHGFADSLLLKVGDKTILATHYGEGHTADNVVVYFSSEDILFGGCLVKELGAQKGFLGDANVFAWSHTVERIKKRFPEVKVVVPGHGAFGDGALLDYTLELFKTRHFGEGRVPNAD
ncbi:MAG: subclass B1 metallo-beta-lactamase [Lunatimonas sp.]|uniref:subclass B1 metallo-beta-lactamase n=1 Tax=Lunatimonas sp. TaxID=2060141 RepID=UPI00263AF26C|nr:subclass B1 metallo-beta-lactamase [Lunatimonas sp.]MCC5938482.1 subclass B1 metallo-beta-lactamase [Lunatimonas sp.]